jgi:sulfofructose kinase
MSKPIVGLGSVALDDVLLVDEWPRADEKVRVRSRGQRLGGLTGQALAAAAMLGARCAYAGRLGCDRVSDAVAQALEASEISTRWATRDAASGVVQSVLVASIRGGTRNVFSHATGITGAHPELPDAEVIQQAAVLMVDHHGIAGSLRAARLAREAAVPVVADFEREDDPLFPALLAEVDHLLLSESFARRWTGAASAAAAVRLLWCESRAVVIVTSGAAGCHVCAGAGEIFHVPAVPVEVVDSSGCGDVFHGAYAAGLAIGETLENRVRLAAAAAALKATRAGLPSRDEFAEFLKGAGTGIVE